MRHMRRGMSRIQMGVRQMRRGWASVRSENQSTLRGFLRMGGGIGKVGLGIAQFVAGPISLLLKAFRAVVSFGVNVVKTFVKIGTAVAAIAVGAAVKGLSAFASYEQQMIRLRAMTGATGEEWQRIEGTVRKVIKESEFMPKSIGQAAVNLAALGVSMADEFETLLPQVRAFATVLGVDIDYAAETLLSTMKQFNRPLDQAADTVTVYANAFVSSAANAERMREAFKYIGFEAGVDKQSLRDTAALVAAIVDRGKDASQAGTALRNVFLTLQKGPPEEGMEALAQMGISLDEVKSSANSYLDILKRLADAGMTADQAAKIFNIRGLGVARVLVELARKGEDGSRAFDVLREKMDRTGVAEGLLEDLTDSLKFKWDVLKGSLSNVFIELGNLVNRSVAVKGGMDASVGAVNELAEALSKISGDSMRDLWEALRTEFSSGALFESVFEAFIAGLALLKPWIIYLAELFGATVLRFIQLGYEKLKEAVGLRDEIPTPYTSQEIPASKAGSAREAIAQAKSTWYSNEWQWPHFRGLQEQWLRDRGLDPKRDWEWAAEYEESLLGDYWKVKQYPKSRPWVDFPSPPTDKELITAQRHAGERWRRAGELVPSLLGAFRQIIDDIRTGKPHNVLEERAVAGPFGPPFMSPADGPREFNVFDYSINNYYGTGRPEGQARPKSARPDSMTGGR